MAVTTSTLEEKFEDEICEHLKNHGWLFKGPLPFKKGFAYDEGYDKRLDGTPTGQPA